MNEEVNNLFVQTCTQKNSVENDFWIQISHNFNTLTKWVTGTECTYIKPIFHKLDNYIGHFFRNDKSY